MANNALKFYRQSSQPTDVNVGAIWFDVTNRTIQVYTATGWEPYAGKLQNAEWDTNKQKLSITKHDGSKIELDFSDMASASAMATALDKKADKTQVATDIADAKAELIGDAQNISDDNTIYGAKIYADGAIAAYHEATIVPALLSATTQLNEKSEGHVHVSMTYGGDGNYVYDISENDIASAQDLSGVDKRVENIEKLISEDGDETINNLNEVIAYFNGVKETETGAGLLTTVAGHTSAIEQINKDIEAVETGLGEAFAAVNEYTVNGYTIVGNPVLNGADIKLDGYAAGTAAPLAATDTINAALGKLEARVDAAAAGGVQSVGGKAGSITLDTDAEGEGNVKFAISEAGEISATVNVGASAAQGVNSVEGDSLVSASFASNKVSVAATEALTGAVALANSAVQGASGDDYVSASVSGKNVTVAANMQAMASASATSKGLAEASDVKAYVDNALCWVEFE